MKCCSGPKGLQALSYLVECFLKSFPTTLRHLYETATAGDEGIYIVQPQFKPGTSQTHIITPSGGIDFGVIAPGKFTSRGK